MKAPDHQVRGMLFICVCLLAGLILYMFLSRAPRNTPAAFSEAVIANDQGVDPTVDIDAASDRREVDNEPEGVADTTTDSDETQATNESYDTATNSPSLRANRAGAGD